MPGPHDFAVRSNLSQRFNGPCAAHRVLAEALKRRSSCAPVNRSQDKPALRS
jgi:hypothetical protein